METAARQTPSLRILIVHDELNIRKTLAVCLEAEGHAVVAVSNGPDALAEASRQSFDLALVDLRLGTASGLDLIPALLAGSPWLKIVVITAYASVETAVEAVRRGATDYLPKPFTPAQVNLVVRKVSDLRTLEQRLEDLQQTLGREHPEVQFDSASAAMQQAMSLAREVAATDATVLITGENGTGKSLLARAIHAWSGRAQKPFAVVSCSSLPADLLESELFGHARGAFTGAVKENTGRVFACDGGTLLFDEIGDLPLALQPKLMRFAQDRQYERVGESATRRADVRIIAATNVDLELAVKEGRFREDLLYRLDVIRISIPPLRARLDDLPGLANGMLAAFGAQNHKRFPGFTDEALNVMKRYSWPGNVRELRNVVERAAILCKSEGVGPDHLSDKVVPSLELPQLGDPLTLEQMEELHIRRVLASTSSLDEAAAILGIDPATLWRKRRKYGI